MNVHETLDHEPQQTVGQGPGAARFYWPTPWTLAMAASKCVRKAVDDIAEEPCLVECVACGLGVLNVEVEGRDATAVRNSEKRRNLCALDSARLKGLDVDVGDHVGAGVVAAAIQEPAAIEPFRGSHSCFPSQDNTRPGRRGWKPDGRDTPPTVDHPLPQRSRQIVRLLPAPDRTHKLRAGLPVPAVGRRGYRRDWLCMLGVLARAASGSDRLPCRFVPCRLVLDVGNLRGQVGVPGSGGG